MSIESPSHVATWLISLVAVLGVIIRPWRIPEALWAVLGAAALVLLALISPTEAWSAVLRGGDVYLFLAGMMVLAELGREQGLFDWLAAYAVRHCRGSAATLFLSVYLVGIIVTVFLSNDATAVVLTPAVYAVTQRANVRPLPYLFICAFIANAASFVLPISNPANLVVYGANLPPLGPWLREFALPSLGAIGATYAALRFSQRHLLGARIEENIARPTLARGGRVAAGGIAAAAVVLLLASSLGWRLGLPAFVAGAGTALVALGLKQTSPATLVRSISWSILPLVAGLFVLVRGLEQTGVLAPLMRTLSLSAELAPHATALYAGGLLALACNLVNNLPLGLIAGTVASGAHLSQPLKGALLIGIDLGPNLSVTGSLATILWLIALRREGLHVSARDFLAVGVWVMPPALILALASLVWPSLP